MQVKFTLLFTFLFTLSLQAQDVATLESFNLEENSFLNNSNVYGDFVDGGLVLPNNYNEEFMSSSGWSISTVTDNTTPGFTNQYSAITGGGMEGSDHYAITFGGTTQLKFSPELEGQTMDGLFITNTTYAYYSMLEGDQFAKKFGGETGDDPDYFLLTIKKYENGELSTDSVDFYLADFRFADNSMDYIVDQWTFVDISSLGAADSLSFTLNSTDVGQFGMNTPAYFAMDNFMATGVGMVSSTIDPAIEVDLNIYPNPTTEVLNINWQNETTATLELFDMQGQSLQVSDLQTGDNQLNVSALANGIYTIKIETATGIGSAVFYKK